MSCCGKPRDSKFCPDCGAKIPIPEIPQSSKIHDFLRELFCNKICSNDYVIIDQSNLNKSHNLNEKYSDYLYVDSERTDEYFVKISSTYYPYIITYGGSIMNAIKNNKYIIKNTINYSKSNEILDGMGIRYFHPYTDETIEETIIGLVLGNISNPILLREVVCDKEYKTYTTTQKCNYESRECDHSHEKWFTNRQSRLNDIISNIASMTTELYMLDDKLYTLDGLNEKYCRYNITIDWKKCIDHIHKLKNINVNVLCDKMKLLLKRIEEDIQITEMMKVIKFCGADGFFTGGIFSA